MTKIIDKTLLWGRNLIYWLFVTIVTIVASLLLILIWPFPAYLRHRIGVLWPYTLLWALCHIIGLHYRVQYEGKVPHMPAIICAKHQSGWETIALQSIFPLQVYVTKKELLFMPFFGWGLALMNAIGIKRSNPMDAFRQMLHKGKKRIQQGFWIVIFPEGTRIQPGKQGEYKVGAVLLAKQLKVPIVPVAHNAGEFWPKKSFLKYPGEVTVVVGEAIMPENKKTNLVLAQLEKWIEYQQRLIGGVGPCADPAEKIARLTR
jgi:1-acyl-sn-glycerol-3-phosphate acyltransferase